MHAQPESCRPTGKARCHRSALTSEEADALHLLFEQGAIPLDQLARLLGGTLADAVGVVQGLDEAGCIEHRRFLVRDHPWFWPSHRGARLSGTGFNYKAPDVAMLAHRRAVNEVRLHLEARAPHGLWICERAVYRQRDPQDHLPDAVVDIDGERHAILVKAGARYEQQRERDILESLMRSYDALIAFAAPRPHGLYRRLASEHHWPKLVIRPIPTSS